MGRVMGVMESRIVGFHFRKTLFGKLVLQVELVIREWDTNTGEVESREKRILRDATEYEASKIVKIRFKAN